VLQSNDGTENAPDCHYNGNQAELNQIKIGKGDDPYRCGHGKGDVNHEHVCDCAVHGI
jgi:hypothetical protein